MKKEKILRVSGLSASYGSTEVIRDISFSLCRREFLGIVGESGCGKSTLLRGIMAYTNSGLTLRGGVFFNGENILGADGEKLRSIRGNDMALIPQNAALSMDPTQKIFSHFRESAVAHRGKVSARQIKKEAEMLMKRLNFEVPENTLCAYPSALSGGMCQRAAIALAMINSPELLLCDEPTSALDSVSKASVAEELAALKEGFGVSAIIVSHDLGLIAALSDSVAVMRGGQFVEYGSREQILRTPGHPYTRALIDAVPKFGGGALETWGKIAPDSGKTEKTELFQSDCGAKLPPCGKADSDWVQIDKGHFVRCTAKREEI